MEQMTYLLTTWDDMNLILNSIILRHFLHV